MVEQGKVAAYIYNVTVRQVYHILRRYWEIRIVEQDAIIA
jgi:hypothetical protein